MRSIFAHENWAECGCCACSIGILDVLSKGGAYVRAGYVAFDESGRLFRTVASRGWGTLNPPSNGPLYNDLQCSFARTFYTAPDTMEFFGFMLSQLWGGPAFPFPWGELSLEEVFGSTPYAESTNCQDGHLEFEPAEITADRILAVEGDGINNPLGPRGVTHLLNEIDTDDAFLELLAYIRGLPFTEGYRLNGAHLTGATTIHVHGGVGVIIPNALVWIDGEVYRVATGLSEDGSFTISDTAGLDADLPDETPVDFSERCYSGGAPGADPCSPNFIRTQHNATTISLLTQSAKYRRRFPIPPAGTVRLEWDIYFTPIGGGPVLFDTLSWQWDPDDVPAGYDAHDPATWPTTDWFEMPPYDPALGYGEFTIVPDDWRVVCGPELPAEAPTDLQAEAA